MGVLTAFVGAVVGALLGWKVFEREPKSNAPIAPVWLGLTGLFLGALLGMSVFQVPAASIGVIYHPLQGGIQHNMVIPEGLHLVSPFTVRTVYSVQTQEYTMSHAESEGQVKGDDSLFGQTNEGLGVYLDLTVLYHVDPHKAPEVWANIGEQEPGSGQKGVENVLVRPFVREQVRMVVARYSVADVYSGTRGKIQEEIDRNLTPVFAQYGIVLEDIKLRDVRYGYKEFAEAIVAKQSAQQQVSTERQNLLKARFERDATINAAMGDYNQMLRKAQALRQNPELIQFEMAKKLAPSTRAIYMPVPGGISR